MTLTVLEGGQSGLTPDEVIQIMADDWGGPVSSNRFKNRVKRRINRAVRDIHLHNPRMRVFTVMGAPVKLNQGQEQYDPRLTINNGGWGWTHCESVMNLIFNEFDNRPLEKIGLDRHRERSELLSQQGPPESWIPIDNIRVALTPVPDATYNGVGDYRTTVPEVTGNAVLGWPHSWDEAMLAGVALFFAMARYSNSPSAWMGFERRFLSLKQDIEWDDKESSEKPRRAVATRDLRSGRHIYRDNSRDDRRWR